jgi:hypothetical protein
MDKKYVKIILISLLFTNIFDYIYAQDNDRVNEVNLRLKILNSTENKINIYLKDNIAIPIERDQYFIIDRIPVIDVLSNFVFIEYSNGIKKCLLFIPTQGHVPGIYSYTVIVNNDGIMTGKEYRIRPCRILETQSYLHSIDNDIRIIIKIINKSKIDKIINITNKD